MSSLSNILIEIIYTSYPGISRWNEDSDGNSPLCNGREKGVFMTIQWGQINDPSHLMFQYHCSIHFEWKTWSHSFVMQTSESLVNLSKHTTHTSWENRSLNWLYFPALMFLRVLIIYFSFSCCSGVPTGCGGFLRSFHLIIHATMSTIATIIINERTLVTIIEIL